MNRTKKNNKRERMYTKNFNVAIYIREVCMYKSAYVDKVRLYGV